MNRIIETFLSEKGYREREDILGIILYGSSTHHTAIRFSDIDLLIITENILCYDKNRINKEKIATHSAKFPEFYNLL